MSSSLQTIISTALLFSSMGLFAVEVEGSLRSDLMNQSGIVKAEFLFKQPPFDGCHASTIEETKDYFVSAFFAGSGEGNEDVSIWVCRKKKGDSEWGKPVKVADGVQFSWTDEGGGKRYPCWNPVLYNAVEGPLLLFYKVGPDPDSWWGMLKTSDVQGSTWSDARRLPEGIYGPIRAKPVRLSDGTLLCGSSTEHSGWRVHMERTRDLGKTWSRTRALNDGEEFGAIQPTILLYEGGRAPYPEGKIQILCRSDGRLRQAWSSDGGKTWTSLRKSVLPNPSAGIDAVNLPDGRKLLVYNHSTEGRSKLNVAITTDGRHWKAALKLEDGKTIGGKEAYGAYPGAILGLDGLVHITYTWRRDRINYVAIDPDNLELKEMPNGRWPQ